MRRQEKSMDRTNAGIRKHNKSNSKIVISIDEMSIDSSFLEKLHKIFLFLFFYFIVKVKLL